MPTPQQVRRALTRAERGAAMDVAEATVLRAARAEDLSRLTAVARRVRDAGLVAVGRPGVVTIVTMRIGGGQALAALFRRV